MKSPNFWTKKNFFTYLFLPLSIIWYLATLLRKIQPKYNNKNLFVICVGNINIGGIGKTPTVITIYNKLHTYFKEQNLKINICILSKTYKASIIEPTFVYSYHKPSEVGDEPFMISQYCTTIVAKKRKEALKFLEDKNIDIVIMDDGLQNPSFIKNYSILVINGLVGFGNNFLIPAGPLRERCSKVIKRIHTIIDYNYGIKDLLKNVKTLPNNLNIINAKTISISDLNKNKKYISFCGIANPIKFKKSLEDYGIIIEKFLAFSDHHSYTDKEIENLILTAKTLNCELITTEKDYVKINQKYQHKIHISKIEVMFEDDNKLINDIINQYKIFNVYEKKI